MKSEIILWADDEIDLLKPHVLFLRQKGYEVVTVTNGRDALDKVEAGHFDLIILDENMPGLSGPRNVEPYQGTCSADSGRHDNQE